MKYVSALLLSFLFFAVSCSKKDEPSTTPVKDVFNDSAFANVPDLQDMTIYEVNLQVFSTSGDLNGATQRLDSVKNLGINVIWLMPIYPIGYTKAVGSPYCVNDYTSVNPAFGTLNDLREFVRAAHKKDMAVILDWVADHTSWDNPWINDPSWYRQDGNGNIVSPSGTNWTDVAQLNYSNTSMRLEMIKSMKFWISQSNIDGFRFDAADFVPDDFWKQAIDSLHAMQGRKLILLAEGGKSADFSDGFQMNYAWDFATTLKTVFQGDKAGNIFVTDSLEYLSVPTGSQKLRYITNHDMYFNSPPTIDYNSAKGSLTAFVIMSFLRGVPLIYDGQELAYPGKISYFQDGSSTPITWTLDPDIYQGYKKAMSIRSSLTSVREGTITHYPDDNVAVFKHTGQQEESLVIANVRDASINFSVPASLVNTTWTNTKDNSTLTFTSQLSLAPYEYLILKK